MYYIAHVHTGMCACVRVHFESTECCSLKIILQYFNMTICVLIYILDLVDMHMYICVQVCVQFIETVRL